MMELVAQLERQLEEQQRIIERMNTNQSNQVEERVNMLAPKEATTPVVRHEPLLIL